MKTSNMKTSYHETSHGEQLVQIIIIGLFFSAFFVAGGTLWIGAKLYDFGGRVYSFGDAWWDEFFGKGERFG